MSINKAQKMVIDKEQPKTLLAMGRNVEQNPLRSNRMTRWLNKNSVKANQNYTAPFEREKQLIELEELFIKFDFDGSGTLDLDELVSMFQMAGLRIPSHKLKNMFHLAKDAKIVKDEVDKKGFQRLMLSPALNKAFRVMLREVRNRVKYNDFSLVDPDVTFLPTDLSLMLGYLYKRSIRNNLTEGIRSDKETSTAMKTGAEVYDQIMDDLERFTGIFHLHDDTSIDVELRRKYRIGALEKQFRKDQNPQKRKEVTQLRAIATFFLNQIKQKAERHKDMGSLIEKGVLNHKIDIINKDRTMKMETELDRKEISMANLHQIQKERQAKEAEKQKKKQEFGKILRALTVTKTRSSQQLSQLKSMTSEDTPVDFKLIADKEERVLYEMISSLQENLEMLDGVQEVFEKEDFDLMLLSDQELRREEEEQEIEEDSLDQNSSEGEEESPWLQKKVTMGKAVFISNPRQKEEVLTKEEKIAQRNAMITQLMHEQTASEMSEESDSPNRRDGYQFMKTNKQLFSEKIREPVKRNATSLMHRSQMNRPSFSNVLLGSNNSLQANGLSVVNKHQTIENHLQDQLKMDSRDLLREMLNKNQDSNLSDFQKSSLRHLRNSSERSKMIIYGDCVNQLERMIETRSKMYNSTENLPQLKRVEEQDSMTKENPLLESTREWTKDEKDGHIKISVNESVTPTRVRKALAQNSESLFSTSHPSTGRAATNSVSKFKPIGKDLAKELKGILAQSRHQQSVNVNSQSQSELGEHKNLLLVSEQAKFFTSSIARRNQMAKGAVTQSAIYSNMHSVNKTSTKVNSDENYVEQVQTGQALPAINQSSSNSISYMQRNELQSQTNTTSHNVKVDETQTENKISGRRFKRNFYASSDLRSKNLSSFVQKDKKPLEDYFSLTQSQQQQLDFNYAGYIAPLKPTAKEVRESFFNSRQDAAKNIAAAKSRSALIKKIVEKARQGSHYKDGETESGEQKLHSERNEVRQIHSVVVSTDRAAAEDASERVPSTVENIYSVVESGTEAGSTPADFTPQKIKKQKGKKSKSPAKKDKQRLASVNSLSKINIADPHILKDIPLAPKLAAKQQQMITVKQSVSKLGVYPSISSLKLQSEKDRETQEDGLPSLAAAQARSMSRKPLNKLGHNQLSKPTLASQGHDKVQNPDEMFTVYGDAVKRRKKQMISQPASDLNVYFDQLPEETKIVQMVDQSISGQQSLLNQSAFDKSALQESLVSESSGRRNHKPIYRGIVEPKRDLPSSSHNVAGKKQKHNPDLERELFAYGPIGVATPPDSIQTSGLKRQKGTKKLDKAYFTNKTQPSFKMATAEANQFDNMVKQDEQGQTMHSQHSSEIKQASPFQQFQERIKKLQMYQPGATPSQMHPEYQQSTPLFREQTQKKSTAQSNAAVSTGGPKKMLSQSKQSLSQNIAVASNFISSATQFNFAETRDRLQSGTQNVHEAVAPNTKRPPKANQVEAQKSQGLHLRKKSSSIDQQLPAMLGTKMSIMESKASRPKASLPNNQTTPINKQKRSLAATEILEESRNRGRVLSSEQARVGHISQVSKDRYPASSLIFLEGATLNRDESNLLESSRKSGTVHPNTNGYSTGFDQNIVVMSKGQAARSQMERELAASGEQTPEQVDSSVLGFEAGQHE